MTIKAKNKPLTDNSPLGCAPDDYMSPEEINDRGLWFAFASESGCSIESDDFTHDVILRVTGDFHNDEQRKAYADNLAVKLNAGLSGNNGLKKTNNVELTEEMVDAPRGFLLGLELGHKNLETMRKHLDNCRYDYTCWPEWAQTETGHITKAGKAILIYTMMQAAAAR